MDILKALEKTGMAHKARGYDWYVELKEEEGLERLATFGKKKATMKQPGFWFYTQFGYILEDDWLPYEPEGEKEERCECVYCVQARNHPTQAYPDAGNIWFPWIELSIKLLLKKACKKKDGEG